MDPANNGRVQGPGGRAAMHLQPRAAAGRDRLLQGIDGTIQRLRCPAAVLLHRWRSSQKPGPFSADASIARPGEQVTLPTIPGQRFTVVL